MVIALVLVTLVSLIITAMYLVYIETEADLPLKHHASPSRHFASKAEAGRSKPVLMFQRVGRFLLAKLSVHTRF